MTHTLYLHGALAQYGDKFELSSSTPYGMIQLLTRQIKGLKKLVKEGKFKLVRGSYEYNNTLVDGRYVELDLPLGSKSQELHLIPVLEGSGGDNGIGKIIIGALITVVAVGFAIHTGGASLSALSASSSIFGISYGSFASFGVALMLGGVSQLLAPKPQSMSQERADETPSYFMTSPVNMASENGAIPILYGEAFAGSHIINASLESVDIL